MKAVTISFLITSLALIWCCPLKAQYLGVGTSNPQDLLHVKGGNVRIEGPLARLRFYNGSDIGSMEINGFNVWMSNNSTGKLVLRTDEMPRLTIDHSGNIGLGTVSPVTRLDLLGLDNGDLTATEGDFRIGNSTYRLKMGTLITGTEAGTSRIYSSGGVSKLILGGNGNDVLTIRGSGEVGIGLNQPVYALDILQPKSRSVNVVNNYSGIVTKYGINIDLSSEGSGQKYGIYAYVEGNPSASSSIYGMRASATGNLSTSSVYGIYGSVSASGTGNRYGVYASAPTANPSASTKSWALYTSGHAYFSSDVRIGTTESASGYRLSVDGKIIAEEIKVQLSQNWPDYVFQDDYKLRSPEELQNFIARYGHLPNIPAAAEVENEGIHLGEINRLLLEKVEELTLYMLRQEERIRILEELIQSDPQKP